MEKIEVLTLKDKAGKVWNVPETHVTRSGKKAIWFRRKCRIIKSERWFVAGLNRTLSVEDREKLFPAIKGDFSLCQAVDGSSSFVIFRDRSNYESIRQFMNSKPVIVSTGSGKNDR